MWQPRERLKHSLPDPGWPTAAEAQSSALFSPVSIGSRTARQRTWVPAMVPWRATEDGFVTDDVIDWYRRFAQGKPGVIVVEATGIRDIPSGPLLRIGHDRFTAGLARLVEAVRDASEGETLLFIQIIDFLAVRRRPDPTKYFHRYWRLQSHHREALVRLHQDEVWLTASDDEVRQHVAGLSSDAHAQVLTAREREALDFGYRERVTDTELDHIRDLPRTLPDLFANAAERAVDSGFDGVELHYAHAYTMASFLSATNTRTDGYGCTRDNRLRLPLEVIQQARARVGAAAILGARFLGDEVIEGGSRLDDAVYYALAFARAGLDFLSLSKGGKFEDAQQPKVGWAVYPYTGQSGYECMPTIYSDARGPFSRNTALAKAVKRALNDAGYNIPVVTAGGIGTYREAEHVLRSGEADIVAAARQTLADPDWFAKMRLGRGQEIRRCHYTNYCEALDQKHKAVTCKLWDRHDLDSPDVTFDVTGKRRLVAPAWSS